MLYPCGMQYSKEFLNKKKEYIKQDCISKTIEWYFKYKIHISINLDMKLKKINNLNISLTLSFIQKDVK